MIIEQGWRGAGLTMLAAVLFAAPCMAGENSPEACSNGVDDDGDGATDCDDPTCQMLAVCADGGAAAAGAGGEDASGDAVEATPPSEPEPENTAAKCTDGVDNDGDGITDCEEEDCKYFKQCAEPQDAGTETATSPGVAELMGGEPSADGCKVDGDCPGDELCLSGQCKPRTLSHGQGGSVAPEKKTADRSKGGFGIYYSPAFIVGSKHHFEYDSPAMSDSYTEDWEYFTFTPAFGIFGEYAPKPYFVIGAEAFFAFPRFVKSKLDGETTKYGKNDTEREIHFVGLVRLKFPIPAGPILSPYPILGLGLSTLTVRKKDAKPLTLLGPSAALGFGLEFYVHRVVTIYIEPRYQFDMGIRQSTDSANDFDSTDWVMHHDIIIQIGFRFG